ncbi:ribonuclease Z [Melghirimyces algeriensis]|uniref:Ribonuclease Z n=1 Tax=Melghirimyces algeriensis TaxID=910412 RepID=A0A521E3I6_9BACL|nr:ribonuclease Z [Melghirimyces algeriensis]SMO77710.1 RNAse Z [Melghirimyces algeriensis]
MEVVFLGTGAGVPSKDRNVSSIALRWTESGGDTWLFDCGEATQHRILHSSVRLSRISRIWITHLHGDHIFGLPGLLGSRSFQDAKRPLTLYGPEGLEKFIQSSLEVSGTHLRYPLHIVEVCDGDHLECEGIRVQVARLEHGIPSYGYRIKEPDGPGALDAERLRRERVPPGPHVQQIKEGKKVSLPDGRMIDGRKYLGPSRSGRHLAILGDTRPTPAAKELAHGVDLLIHEATYAADQEALAWNYFHSTSVQAAELALAAGVRRLVVTHISPRYSLDEGKRLAEEAQAVFSDTEVARDGFAIRIEKRIVK